MNKATVTFREARAFLALCYPASVMAANNALGTQFDGYTPATWGILVLLICIGGLTGMLHRLKSEYENKGVLTHPKLFILSNFFGAMVAGVLALLVGEGFGWAGWLMAIGILISSFAGTLLIERAWQSFASKYLPTDGPDTKLGELVKRVAGEPAPVPATERLGPVTQRGALSDGKGNEGKYD